MRKFLFTRSERAHYAPPEHVWSLQPHSPPHIKTRSYAQFASQPHTISLVCDSVSMPTRTIGLWQTPRGQVMMPPLPSRIVRSVISDSCNVLNSDPPASSQKSPSPAHCQGKFRTGTGTARPRQVSCICCSSVYHRFVSSCSGMVQDGIHGDMPHNPVASPLQHRMHTRAQSQEGDEGDSEHPTKKFKKKKKTTKASQQGCREKLRKVDHQK